jgi:hypothetical protein
MCFKNKQVEDPRAGMVDVELPQLPVDYEQLAKKLLDLGSGPTVSKSNRDSLYMLSKYFKEWTWIGTIF